MTDRGIYIHIPICESKCRYCDFYSFSASDAVKEEYTKALCREITKRGGNFDRPFTSLYIGGGTPSVLGEERLCKIILAAKESFDFVKGAEITVEVNPKTGSEPLFAALKSCTVNRLSMGVQSANDEELEMLGRAHTNATAKNAFFAARSAGFDNISLDLMIGLPDSDEKSVKKSLDFLCGLAPEHISVYILKLEENTPLYNMRHTLDLPDEDEVSRQYMQACTALKAAGYEHYEISNFSKKGKRSRHNMNYWKCGQYLGLGPAAHSFIDGKRFFYPADMKAFIDCPNPKADGEGGDISEYIMLNLRLSDGLDLSELKGRFGVNPANAFIKKAKLFEKGGLCRLKGDNLSLTDAGMLVSNEIITELECSL